MILIDAAFWASVGLESFDGNDGGTQYDFYRSMVVNGVAVNNQYDFFLNSTVGGVVYYNQYDWYKAIGVLYNEPIYDQYTFMQNVTFDGVNAVGNQYEFFKYNTPIELCRFFTALNEIDQYYTIPTVTLTGDFEIEFKGVNDGDSSIISAMGTSGDSLNRINLNNNNLSLPYRANGIGDSFALGMIATSNNLTTINIKKIGDDFITSQDGVILETRTNATFAAEALTLDAIGQSNNRNYWNNVLADVKIFDHTVSTTEPIRYYKLDEDFSVTGVVKNSATTLGSEEVTNGAFDSDVNDWTGTNGVLSWNSGGYAQIVGDNDEVQLSQVIVHGITDPVLVTFDIKSSSYNGQIRTSLNQGSDYLVVSDFLVSPSWQTVTLVFPASIVTQDIRIRCLLAASATIDYDNVSVKQANGYGTAVNITESEEFCLDGCYWLGVELVTGGDMNNPADWFLPASWEISGGTMNATLEDLDANQVTGTVIGRHYLTYFETSNISNGETRIKVGETGGIVRSTTGAWTEILTASFNSTVGIDGRFMFTGSVDNVSVKRILQISACTDLLGMNGEQLLGMNGEIITN